MEKMVKVTVRGALGANGRLNATAEETIALYVDPFDKQMRSFVMQATVQRFAWLEFVPLDQLKAHWIGEWLGGGRETTLHYSNK